MGAEIDTIEDGAFLLAMEPELLSEVELFFLDIYMERSNGFDIRLRIGEQDLYHEP